MISARAGACRAWATCASLFPLPCPLRPQRPEAEGRKPGRHETRSAALDNVHEGKKKKKQAHTEDTTAPPRPPAVWVLLSTPRFPTRGNRRPEMSCRFPQNHFQGQQPERRPRQTIHASAGIGTFLRTVLLGKGDQGQQKRRERSLQMGPGEAVPSGGDGLGVQRRPAR